MPSPVLVAGAGPVGLALAGELARHGVPSRIIDKTAATKTISKALILHVRTLETFDAMGIVARAKSVSVPMRDVQVHAYGRRVGQWVFDRTVLDSPHSNPVILGQDRTERLLHERLQELGGSVEWNTELVGFEQDQNGVTARIKKPDGTEETSRYDYLVGCEGAHSVTRKGAGVDFHGDAYTGEQFIQADCRIAWELPSGSNYLFLTDTGYLMVIEMPDGIVRIFISLPDPDPHLETPPTLDEIRDNLVRLTGQPADLSDPIWLARYRTSHRRASSFRVGRVFLAGDAGHVHVPIGGQGMNTGLQDAFNLGWKLASVLKGESPPRLLDSYDAERVPVAEQLLAGTDRAYRFVLHPGNLMKRAIRSFGPFLMSLHTVQEKAVTTLEEVNVGYPHGPLSESHDAGSPQAGERALDAVVVESDGWRTVHLFDAIRGTKWNLLLFGGTTADEEAVKRLRSVGDRVAEKYGRSVAVHLILAEGGTAGRVLLDREHFLHDKYNVKRPTLVLIRPDWYVGFRGRESHRDELMEYLGRVLNPASGVA